MEIAVVGLGVEVGDSGGKLDSGKETSSLLGANLLSCTRQSFG